MSPRRSQPRALLLGNRVFLASVTFVLLALASLGAYAYSSRGGASTQLKLKLPLGGSIELTSSKRLIVTEQKAGKFNSTAYFVSKGLRFAFKKPETPSDWSPVKNYKGLPPEQVTFFSCVAREASVPSIVSRTVAQTTGEMLRVTMSKRTTVDFYGTMLRSGIKGMCTLPFRNGIFVEVIPKSRLREVTNADLSLPGFLGFAISQLGIRLDKLTANQSQILGTWTYRAHHVRLRGNEDDFTEYRAFSFTQTESNFYITEITFSPDTNTSPDEWIEMQHMLESFRLIQKH